MQNSKKTVIVISSHVVRGSIGNRAAVFALEALEHSVWAVPTVILPWHPGHGQANRILVDGNNFIQLLEDLKKGPADSQNWLDEVGAVLTGYMANAEQAKAVAEFVSYIKSENKSIIHVCDPVMGDGEKLYIDEDTAKAIKHHLVPIADAITPNLFELGWLTDKKITNMQEALDGAKKFKNKSVLATSIPGMMRNQIGNLLFQDTTENYSALFCEHRIVGGPTNGAGDLTSAIFTAHLLNTPDREITIQRTTASVFEIIANSAKQGADELLLEVNTHSIKRPMAMVQTRAIGQSPVLAQNIRKAPKRNIPQNKKNISPTDNKT